MDPRKGALEGEPHGQVDGHAAVLVDGKTLEWRCDKSARLFRLQGPDLDRLAAEVRCHAIGAIGNGEVPTASSSVLGAGWRFGNRGRGSISWLRDDEVLTYFAGQQLPPPRDAEAARNAAPEWAEAAGLEKPSADDAAPAQGPQGHPALIVHGKATLDGRPVRWSLLTWRCLQRQRTFTAIVFAEKAPDDAALLSARCHG